MKTPIFCLLILIGTYSIAQENFSVKNGYKNNKYNTLDLAIKNSSNGDTIYLPKGIFSLKTTAINKTLHWIGKVHENKKITEPLSIITNSVHFKGNCDNSSFSGIFFKQNIAFGDSNDETINIIISKSRIDGNITLRNSNVGKPVLNFQMKNSICKGSIDAKNGKDCLIKKSIFWWRSTISNFNDSEFNANIFSSYDYNKLIIINIHSSTFENNIFTYHYNIDNTSQNCNFHHNLFTRNLPYTEDSTHKGYNNITNVNAKNIFSKIEGDIRIFSAHNDYRLKKSCPGINAAKNGGNLGLYGIAREYSMK